MSLVRAAAAAVLALAVAAPANALVSPVSPVTLRACRITQRGYLRVVYVNHAHVAADRVDILTTRRGVPIVEHDAGTFSPGVRIVHRFPSFLSERRNRRPKLCQITTVHFVDGRSWAFR